MARVTQDGEVFGGEDLGDVQLGTVEKFSTETSKGWLAKCSRDANSFTGEKKTAAVDLLEDHFIVYHTTLRS